MVRQPFVTLIPIHFPTVRPGEKLTKVVRNCLKEEGLTLRRGDILAVVSKIVSACEERIVKLTDLQVTNRTSRLAVRWKLDELLAAAVMREADEILGGVNGFLLTMKNGFLTPNAGIDLKNSPPGTATLWPSNPDRSAASLRKSLEHLYHARIGVVIVDSRVTPLRLGTVGLAIGLSGFSPIRDHRGVLDIFGRPIRVTQTNVADDLAAAAHLLMGESSEHIGAVLIRGTATRMDTVRKGQPAKMSRQKCLIGSSLMSRENSTR
ncbi:MAG TPA: coenzyme F420-0:L-glutamate ligase [Candidatus Acidoferrales bacterium]|nr:coenzyme F420-0:L-glutamate ligase [Candidatus Acidoferrales bacterium]